MGKLHELLAVEPDLKAEAQRLAKKVLGIFGSESALVGKIRTYQPLEEGGQTFADEITELATKVGDELAGWEVAFSAWLDAATQKEVTNQGTSANVVVDGTTLFESMPATALLNLESKLAEIRQIFNAIPTNDPTEHWEWDEQQDCWVSRERISYRTHKAMRSHVAYHATEQHPAQVETYTEDIRAGVWTSILQSGMLSPVEKQARLKRIDTLIRAVKQARQRANDIDVVNVQLGQKLFDYIWE